MGFDEPTQPPQNNYTNKIN